MRKSSIPGLAQWVGNLALPRLWCRLAATAPLQPPSLGPSICPVGTARKRQKKKKTQDIATPLAVSWHPLRAREESWGPDKTEKDTGQQIPAPSSFSGWCWYKRGPTPSVNRPGPPRPSFRPLAKSLQLGCLPIARTLPATARESSGGDSGRCSFPRRTEGTSPSFMGGRL